MNGFQVKKLLSRLDGCGQMRSRLAASSWMAEGQDAASNAWYRNKTSEIYATDLGTAPVKRRIRSCLYARDCGGGGFGGVTQMALRYPAPARARANARDEREGMVLYGLMKLSRTNE